MKRLMLFLSLSLTTLMPAAPALADPANPPDLGIVAFCKYDVPTNHPDLSVGNCIGSRTTANHSFNGWVEHACFFMQNEQPDVFYMYYDTYAECVRDQAAALLN